MSRSIPILGAAIAAVTVVATMRRKGVISGVLDTGLNAMPGIGAAKNVIEIARGRDFFPDRPRPKAVPVPRIGRTGPKVGFSASCHRPAPTSIHPAQLMGAAVSGVARSARSAADNAAEGVSPACSRV